MSREVPFPLKCDAEEAPALPLLCLCRTVSEEGMGEDTMAAEEGEAAGGEVLIEGKDLLRVS